MFQLMLVSDNEREQMQNENWSLINVKCYMLCPQLSYDLINSYVHFSFFFALDMSFSLYDKHEVMKVQLCLLHPDLWA